MLNFNFNQSSESLNCENIYQYFQFSLQDYFSDLISGKAQTSNHCCVKYIVINSNNLKSDFDQIKELCLKQNLTLILQDEEDEYVYLDLNNKSIVLYLRYYDSNICCSLTYFAAQQSKISLLEKEILKFNVPKKMESNFVFSFCQRTGYPPEIKKIGAINSFFHSENYSSEVNAQYPLIVKQLSSSSPGGRLLVLEGPPGTGKTHFIRSVISSSANEKTVFILLDYQSASSVSGSELLNTLLNFKSSIGKKSITFIIEDADHFLHTRDNDNINVISSLLNLTDGIIGDALDIRVIASTNISLENIEAALIRPGRLMNRLFFGPLDPTQCGSIFYRLTGQEKQFSSSHMLCEMYEMVRVKG